jgi:protein phosphatase
MTHIHIPEYCLVVLIGASGSGKSTFARTHFAPFEVLSSDHYRGVVSDDENNQVVSTDAFDVLHYALAKRLKNMRLTVIDATNVQRESRAALLKIAREYYTQPVAIVLDMPEHICIERNAQRPDRQFGAHVIQRQRRDLKRSLGDLEREGFRYVHVLRSLEDIAQVTITRDALWNNKRDVEGPFDIIGDIHGCFDELVLLLTQLGYAVAPDTLVVTPPENRRLIFLGDLVDRGPKTPQVLKLVMQMVAAKNAFCVPGNHDVKLMKALRGKKVQITYGLQESLTQLEAKTPEFREQVAAFIDALVSHYVFDQGKLVVAHAGMKENMAGRASGEVREFALYGDTTGETDEFGLPVRYNWAQDYRGSATVVYGHTPIPEPDWLNRTVNIDTGCVFGGALTALRYPEREIVSVPALHTYAEPKRPFLPEDAQAAPLTKQQQLDSMLEISDMMTMDGIGKRVIETRLQRAVQIRAENAAAALEVMSRFAVNPKWLLYLPPTMSPVATSNLPDMLEHPSQAFSYYRDEGIAHVICEEKHMGSRAVAIVCQDEAAAQTRFGIIDEGIGVVYTRTGRRFFNDLALETAFLARIRNAINTAGLWAELGTSWLALDCELMPWSAKAQELLQTQYASVGAVAQSTLGEAVALLEATQTRLGEQLPLHEQYNARKTKVEQYIASYRRYCWDVQSIEDLRLAPFHLLASEGGVHIDKSHVWHMETLARLRQSHDPLLRATPYRVVDLTDEASITEATEWWTTLTEAGGEGMVVKPMEFIARGRRGLLQPALKVRGREYLRIIYGPEYDTPAQIAQLRARGLGAKRSLALREFALGVEAMERFVRHEPLRRVHECVFGVLALESEPVDPRL